MNMRVRQLWAPVLSTFLVSASVQFVALRVPQLPPWVFFTRNGVSIVLAPLWVLALPFIGALGAWLSLRAGGNTRDRLLSALSPTSIKPFDECADGGKLKSGSSGWTRTSNPPVNRRKKRR